MRIPNTVTHALWLLACGGAFWGGLALRRSPVADGAVDSATPESATASNSAVGKGQSASVSRSASLDAATELLHRLDQEGAHLSPERMKVVMTEVLSDPDPVHSSLLFSTVLEKLTKENAPVAVAEIQARMGGFEGMRFMGLLAYKWGAMDGPSAMAEVAKQDGPAKMMSTMSALTGWAASDPAAAQQWYSDPKTGADVDKKMALRGLVSGIARADAASAVQFVSSLPDHGDRQRMAEVIADEKIRQGSEAAAQWVDKLTDPLMKKGAFGAVAQNFYRNDPKQAIDFVKQHAKEPYAKDAASELARRLAAKDPREGVDFSAGLPQGEARQGAYLHAFRTWAEGDPAAASKALQGMPKGADRDAAIPGLAAAISKDDPQSAIIWSESIGDPALRSQAIIETLRRQYRRQPEQAIEYMNSKGWSAELQNVVKREMEEDAGAIPFRKAPPPPSAPPKE